MKKKFRHMALIPARGGSTGIENKNLQKIGQKSLVQFAWNDCLSASFFDYICLSTNSNEIAMDIFPNFNLQSIPPNSVSGIKKNCLLHNRSDLHSLNHSSVYDLILEFSKNKELYFDFLWLIQPTSPFRSLEEFYEIKKIAESEKDFTSIVSVKDVLNNHPDRMFEIKNKSLKKIYDNLDNSLPRQILPKVYIKDGGYYVFKFQMLAKGVFLGDKILPFIRPNSGNVNIDSWEDLDYARHVYNFRLQNP